MYRNKTLLSLVREYPCQICGKQNQTVVAAHGPKRWCGGGTGIKPADLYVIPACFRCHNVLDGRDMATTIPRSERDEMWLRAWMKWMLVLAEHERLQIVGKAG